MQSSLRFAAYRFSTLPHLKSIEKSKESRLSALESLSSHLYFSCEMKSAPLVRFLIPLAAALLLASCTTLYTNRTGAYTIAGIQAEERTNGYVFKIEAAENIGRVEAWIGQNNWLYMSIPDTSINAGQLDQLRNCPVVANMQVFRYSSSVQVTLQLNKRFDHVGVLKYPGDHNVYVVLYKFNEGL